MRSDKKLVGQAPKHLLFLTILLSWLGALTGIALWWRLSLLLHHLVIGTLHLRESRDDLIALGSLLVIRFALHYAQNRAATRMASVSKAALRQKILDEQILCPALYGAKHPSGELSTLWVRGVESTDPWFSQYLPQRYVAIIIPLTVLAIAWVIDPLSALIFLISAPLIPIFMVLIGGIAEKLSETQWQKITKLGAFFLDTLQGLKTLRLFSLDKIWEERLQSESQDLSQATVKVLRVAFLSALVLEWIGSLSTAILAVQLGIRLLNGYILFQHALFLLMIAPEFYLPMRLLGMRYHAALEGISAAKRVYGASSQNPPSLLQLLPPRRENECFHLENLTVKWTNRPAPALKDFSLTVYSAEFLGITGPSGSGKSTLFAALLGLAPVQSGKLHTVAPDWSSWLQQIAWVPQHPTLFRRTLRENLTLGSDFAQDDKSLIAALDQVGLLSWYKGLIRGLDTPLGDDGALISGGEKRRIALARALLRQPRILLLDEPDAHLDNAAADHILRMLRAQNQITRILIAHRAETLAFCDRVISL